MSGAVLFHGSDHDSVIAAIRKRAIELLEVSSEDALLNHGDYQEVRPTSKSYLYSMETIQSVVKESALPPFRGKKRIIALFSIDRMLPVHANALLKTLEDAPENFVLILGTTRYNDIMKTILSRVQKEHVEGIGELEDYSDAISGVLEKLHNDQFDSFLKEVDDLSKKMGEDIVFTEKNLRNFLETFMKVSIAKAKKRHLVGIDAAILEKLCARSLVAFHGNIRLKLILENLFLESQQLCHSN